MIVRSFWPGLALAAVFAAGAIAYHVGRNDGIRFEQQNAATKPAETPEPPLARKFPHVEMKPHNNCENLGAWLRIDEKHDFSVVVNNWFAAIMYQTADVTKRHRGAAVALGFHRDGTVTMQYVDDGDRCKMQFVDLPLDVVQRHLRHFLDGMKLEAESRRKEPPPKRPDCR